MGRRTLPPAPGAFRRRLRAAPLAAKRLRVDAPPLAVASSSRSREANLSVAAMAWMTDLSTPALDLAEHGRPAARRRSTDGRRGLPAGASHPASRAYEASGAATSPRIRRRLERGAAPDDATLHALGVRAPRPRRSAVPRPRRLRAPFRGTTRHLATSSGRRARAAEPARLELNLDPPRVASRTSALDFAPRRRRGSLVAIDRRSCASRHAGLGPPPPRRCFAPITRAPSRPPRRGLIRGRCAGMAAGPGSTPTPRRRPAALTPRAPSTPLLATGLASASAALEERGRRRGTACRALDAGRRGARRRQPTCRTKSKRRRRPSPRR